jgi:hypothetical protein
VLGTDARAQRLADDGGRGRLRPPVGWAAVVGGGAIAGIGFTVSILIATLAFSGDRLEEAKLGVLSAALVSSLCTWLLFRVTARLPVQLRVQALLGSSQAIVDLAAPVDDERDHIRGPADAPVTVVEYGDFECPYCGQAEAVMRDLLAGHGDVRYVWRHLPLNDVHPNAQLAAEAAEAAAEQGSFWDMHDLLLSHQSDLRPPDLVIELDVPARRIIESWPQLRPSARASSCTPSVAARIRARRFRKGSPGRIRRMRRVGW